MATHDESSWPDRTRLPIRPHQTVGRIDRTVEGSDPVEWPREVAAPEGAPNVLLVMTDDVGFGASEVFGGPREVGSAATRSTCSTAG